MTPFKLHFMPQTRRTIQRAPSTGSAFLRLMAHSCPHRATQRLGQLWTCWPEAECGRGQRPQLEGEGATPGVRLAAAPNKARWSLGRPSPLPPALDCPALRRLQLPGYPPGAQVAGRGRGALPAVTKCLIEAGGASRSLGRARTPYRAGLMQSAAAAIQLASN